MKKIMVYGMSVLLAVFLLFTACSENSPATNKADEGYTAQKQDSLAMSEDSLYSHILKQVVDEVVKRRLTIMKEALTVMAETEELLRLMDDQPKKAIDKGHLLIGKMEVLLTKDPAASLIPVDVNYRKEELVTDIETVRKVVDAAQEAMDDGYYQAARSLLSDLKSEMVINSFYVPAATYPEAIKVAVALLEDGKTEEAKAVLQKVLNTIVIKSTILPLPILKAEQMVKEAAKIDAESHENVDQVLNLLKNAHYQLQLAEALGYGKKDKEYKNLYDEIENLQDSVSEKEDSGAAFDSLKKRMKGFKERLFPIGGKENK